MKSFVAWRSRLPASIGNWFSRDLTRIGLTLAEQGRVTLRAIDDAKIEATVKTPTPLSTVVEWTSGTGPQALRPVCGCGATGVCEHVVAVLEAVRTHADGVIEPAASSANGAVETDDADYSWLPSASNELARARARAIWPVIVLGAEGAAPTGTLYLDTPRLKGVIRDAQAILTMMEGTPADDWDDADRDLMRDDAVQEAFGGARTATKALARAFFRLARHPRLRCDDEPGSNKHPSEMRAFGVDLRGLRLRAIRTGARFSPALETVDGTRFRPVGAIAMDGPPTWLVHERTAYLVDGAFDVHRVIAASSATAAIEDAAAKPSARTIARVAPFLPTAERTELGVTDARDPALLARVTWRDSSLLARLAFVDRTTNGRAPFSPLGAIAQVDDRFVRFSADLARAYATRFTELGFVPRSADTFALHDADRAARAVRDAFPTWDDVEIRLDETLVGIAEDNAKIGISIGAQKSGEREDWFELSVDVFVDDGAALTAKELAAVLASKGRYAEIRGKLVDVAQLRAREALIGEISERRQSGLAALVALRDELHESFGDAVALPAEVEALRERLRNFEGIVEIEPPEAVAEKLRGYQRKGLDFLNYLASFSFGGILADDMGLGKTLQVISYLLKRKLTEGQAPSLVIAPTSVTHTWESEIAKFAPELTTLRLASGSERAARFEEIPNVDVVITSYALARLDAQQLGQITFRTLVLDEAQNAKNPSSQIAKVVRGLRSEHRLALTGTPVENSLRDLWAIFAFVEPGLLGTEASFRRRFENPIADGDVRAINRLRSRLEPFVLRRTKEDVARELPSRTEQIIECELSPLQKRLYRGIAEAARRDILSQIGADGMESAAVHVLAALTRLRQVCAHPGLIMPQYIDELEASAKFDAFMETIDEILSGGHRVLVFSAFASMLKIMRNALERKQITFGYLDGSTKDKERQSEVERFMQPDGPSLFLCSLKAGGVGLTLTAADYVILYDPWWNPAVERQAIDRTHRIGQLRPVTAYRLVTRGSVEEKIRQLAERKSALSKTVIKADSAVAKSLTRDDLEMLFADPE
jgi:superfamily II DNA or RNA helicase